MKAPTAKAHPRADSAPFKAQPFLIVVILCVLSGLGAIVLGVQHVYMQRSALQNAQNTARRVALDQVAIINARLQKLTPVAEGIAADLTSGALKPEDVTPRLRKALEDYPDFFEAGIAYIPFGKGPGVRLFSPHVSRDGARINEFRLEERYDYTTYDWYKDGMAVAAPHWGEPYLGGATKTLVVGYSVPFYRKGDPGKTPIGLVRTNLSLDRIHKIISTLGLGETGYGFLLSRKGVYLSDPVEEYMRDQRTIFEVARLHDDPGRQRLGEKVVAGQPGREEGISGVTGQATWMFTEPVSVTSWSLGTVFMQAEMSVEPQLLRRSLIRIACCSMVFLFLLSLVWYRVHEATDRALWNTALTTAAIFLAGIAFIWGLTLHYPDRNGEVGVHIYDDSSLQKFLNMNVKSAEDIQPVEQVKTGIFIRTVRFGTANDVSVTGQIWQRYATEYKDFTPGFMLPNAETLEVKEAYRLDQGDNQVVGWDFKATLREKFEGSIKYPFDRAMVRIRIAPRGFYKNLVLVPDLESYQLLVPASLPGTDKALVLPGWNLASTYFVYSPMEMGTTFGVPMSLEQEKGQEFGFTMVAQRQFLDPFISSVLPIIVVASLLFGLLLIGSKQSHKITATGFKATDIVRAGVALLFPVLLAQVNLRSKIGSSNIIYIEYFYFVLYTAILGVAANALLFTLKGHGISQYRDNIVPKLLFWPSLLGACFGVTLVFLY
jgi:hypothetical protein